MLETKKIIVGSDVSINVRKIPSLLTMRIITLIFLCALTAVQAAVPGSLDESYQPILDGAVKTIAPLPDGKAYVLGSFNTVNGVSRPGIARLNEDGTLDAAFDPGSGASANGYLKAVLIQNDGDILVTGSFTNFNGSPHFGIVRLKPDGSVDPAFTYDARIGINGINCVAQQPDGKIIISGEFDYLGVAHDFPGPIARLNSDGSLDSSFALQICHDWWPGYLGMITTESFHIGNIIVRTNGQILFGGAFTMIDTSKCPPGTSIVGYDEAGALALDPKGNVLAEGFQIVAGPISTPEYRDGIHVEYFHRLGPDRSADYTFEPQLNNNTASAPLLTQILAQPNGKIVIAGTFNSVRTEARNHMARLNENGWLDQGFDPQAGTDWPASSIAIQSDGSYLVGGGFTKVNGVDRSFLARLHGDDLSPRPPTIYRQSGRQEVAEGFPASVWVAIDGPSVFYQWQFNGIDIPGATNVYYNVANALSVHEGFYTVLATNAWGSVTSAPSQLLLIHRLGDALNAPELDWKTSKVLYSQSSNSDPAWYWESSNTHDGVAALSSAAVNPLTTAMNEYYLLLQTQVTGPGRISFWYNGSFSFGISKTNSLYNILSPNEWDYSIYRNSSKWQKESQDVPPGPKILEWCVAIGYSGCILDEVTYVPLYTHLAITSQSSNSTNGACQFSLIGPTNEVVRIERSSDLKNWSSLMTVTNQTESLIWSDPNPTNEPYLFYRAVKQ